jgi:hypothetical protein
MTCPTLAAVSEIQYYEFLAADRPLTAAQQAEVREFSASAEISASSLSAEYYHGDFQGDPPYLLQHYYDAHLYTANWGSRRLMLKLPCTALDPKTAEQYTVHDRVTLSVIDDHLIVDVTSENDDEDEEEAGRLTDIAGVRAEIAAGDLRPLYLIWLAAYGEWERDESFFDDEDEQVVEPPVPVGLDQLTSAQRALADFLRLDDDLLQVAAEAKPDDPEALAASVSSLPDAEKDRLLLSVAYGQCMQARTELLRNADPSRRTVGELLDTAADRHE